MARYEPTMHYPVPMGARVVLPSGFCATTQKTGQVVGIAQIHVVFQYIILLDEPIETEYGIQRAVSAPGTILETSDGTSWRLK